MSTPNKKPVRRVRQKKQLLDDEDLQKQEELQKAIQQGKLKQQSNDIFDTAKLDKNYFVRQQNKTINHEQQVFNFDQQTQYVKQQPIKSQNKDFEEEEFKQKKSSTLINKRRDQRRKQKNENIFDEQEEQEGQNEGEIVISKQTTKQQDFSTVNNNTTDPSKTNNNLNQQKNTFNHSQKLQQKQQNQPENDQISDQQEKQQSQNQQKQQEDQEQQQEDDDFDNVIRQEAEKSQEEEKSYILHKQIAKFKKEDLKLFYYQTLKPNQVACAYFKRFSSGLSEVYQLCGEDHRPLLFCQNQRGCIGANYYISMTKQMDKNNPSYLGKLRGNAAGSTYHLYDCGIQPKNQINRSDWRVSMASIEYENNFMGMNGPRKIKVTTPSAKLLQDADTFKLSEEESLLSFQPPIVTQFRNKTPKWNEKLKSYALNFGGRVKMASIKNFIMINNEFDIEDEDEAENVIIFGKVDDTTFSLEYRYPLSLFQAFGIVMSEFDFKLSCE